MTALGLVGLMLGLAAWRVACVNATQEKLLIFLAAAIVHIVCSIMYYLYVQNNPADTTFYYLDPSGFSNRGFALGTQAVLYLVQTCKRVLGGTYLDYFLVFQSISFWGVALLMRAIEEVYLELGVEQPVSSYFVLFLPGIHFWPSAIGKDAPLFLGCSLAVWAAMRLHTRYTAFAMAVLVMLIFRPHVALIALVALTFSTAFDRNVPPFTKVALLLVATVGTALTALTLRTTLGLDVTSTESVVSFFEAQSELTSEASGSTAVVEASYPVRFISLLFRPFFIDAGGALGMVASLENLLIGYILYVIAANFVTAKDLVKSVFFLRFSIIFVVALASMLAFVYYNVGLGLRQKTMLMPALLTFYSALVAVRQVGTSRPVTTAA